jgi:phage minor structural protein
LCENFETWVDFNIDRNDDGSIISKKVMFKNYIGVQNYAGFKYGVNLQSISRKIDSANIVTKMIVKNNSN